MPIYEYECRYWEAKCGRFELIRPISEYNEKAQCPHCGALCARVPSLYTPRPDTCWAGVVTDYGYTTSSSRLKREMKRRNHVPVGDRRDREAWDKIAEDAQKDKAAKLKKDVRGWSERTFGPGGLGLGGADGEKFIKEHT